jgi:hypothetical protein
MPASSATCCIVVARKPLPTKARSAASRIRRRRSVSAVRRPGNAVKDIAGTNENERSFSLIAANMAAAWRLQRPSVVDTAAEEVRSL